MGKGKVLVVGGGIVGLSTAWSLIARGFEVELFEQGPLPNPSGSSYDEHRILRHAYGTLTGYAQMVPAAFARWEALKRQVALYEQRLLPLARDRSAAALAAYRAGGELQPWLDARTAELDIHRSHAERLGELGHAWAALAFLIPEATP